jgi:tetratricopeptide (TPR) repeat protein
MDGRDPIDPEREHEIDGTDDRESPYGLLRRGQELMRSRHFAQAAIVLERAARMEPSKGSILEALGRASYNAGDHARAAVVFAELLEVDPSAHYAHYALGQSLKQLRRPDEARTHLRIAVALVPGSRLYGSALRRLGGDGTALVVGEGGATPESTDDDAGATADSMAGDAGTTAEPTDDDAGTTAEPTDDDAGATADPDTRAHPAEHGPAGPDPS